MFVQCEVWRMSIIQKQKKNKKLNSIVPEYSSDLEHRNGWFFFQMFYMYKLLVPRPLPEFAYDPEINDDMTSTSIEEAQRSTE